MSPIARHYRSVRARLPDRCEKREKLEKKISLSRILFSFIVSSEVLGASSVTPSISLHMSHGGIYVERPYSVIARKVGRARAVRAPLEGGEVTVLESLSLIQRNADPGI